MTDSWQIQEQNHDCWCCCSSTPARSVMGCCGCELRRVCRLVGLCSTVSLCGCKCKQVFDPRRKVREWVVLRRKSRGLETHVLCVLAVLAAGSLDPQSAIPVQPPNAYTTACAMVCNTGSNGACGVGPCRVRGFRCFGFRMGL